MIKIVALMKRMRIYFSQTISSVAAISILSHMFIDIFFGTMIRNFVNYIIHLKVIICLPHCRSKKVVLSY